MLRPAAARKFRFQGPELIAIGLVVLLAAGFLPAAPIVTAVAIVALGATRVTLARFRSSPALLPALLLHMVTYCGLYVLVVGAVLHEGTGGIGFAAAADLAASTVPMAGVLRCIVSCLDARTGHL